MTTVEQPKAPSLFRQLMHHFGGQFLMMAAGIVSMPILQRNLSEAEFGVAGLIITMMTVLTAISKAGIPPASVRLAGRPKPGQEREEQSLQSSLIMASVMTSGTVAVLVIAAVLLYLKMDIRPDSLLGRGFRVVFGDRGTAWIVLLAVGQVVTRTLTAVLWALMKAEQRSARYNIFAVLQRYVVLAFSLGGYFLVHNLGGYFVGFIVADVIVVGWFLGQWWSGHRLSPWLFSLRYTREALAYGLPLIVYEVVSTLVAYSDKFIIRYFKGDVVLGQYNAGYGVAELLPALLVFPIEMAIVPYCFRIWDNEGPERTGEFVASSAARYAVAVFPAMALFCAVASTVILYLGDPTKYARSVGVVPWVVAGQVLWQAFGPLVGMGFYVQKSTVDFTKVQCVALVLNAALNLVMVPVLSYHGAAIATFLTYAATIVIAGVSATRYLRVPWRWASMVRAAVLATLVAAAVWALPIGHALPAALLRLALGSIVYTRAMVLLDDNARWVIGSGFRLMSDRGMPTRWYRLLTGYHAGLEGG